MSNGKGAININVLWEMGGAQRILHGVLERTAAWSPASPAARACLQAVGDRRLLRRQLSADHQLRPRLQRAVEAGLFQVRRMARRPSSTRIPGSPAAITACPTPRTRSVPQDPYPRVKALRETMRQGGISDDVPIVMAGGVWNLKEWEHWIDNPELGQIAFQFGTRPLLTQESPIPEEWKQRLMTLEEGDVLLHRFSPTGFYSLGGAQRRSCAAWRRARSARSPSPRSRSAIMLRARRRRRQQEELSG
jgi:nitronate monooxygenase